MSGTRLHSTGPNWIGYRETRQLDVERTVRRDVMCGKWTGTWLSRSFYRIWYNNEEFGPTQLSSDWRASRGNPYGRCFWVEMRQEVFQLMDILGERHARLAGCHSGVVLVQVLHRKPAIIWSVPAPRLLERSILTGPTATEATLP